MDKTTREITARDIMVTDFGTIRPAASVREAARMIHEAKPRPSGHRTVSLVVTDDFDHLVGVITLFDILYRVRPPFLDYGPDSVGMWTGEVEAYIEQFKGLTVEQVMSAPVLTASPDDHLMVIIDRMVKKKSRRLPVVEDGKVIGVVYLSEVFHHLCKTWLR